MVAAQVASSRHASRGNEEVRIGKTVADGSIAVVDGEFTTAAGTGSVDVAAKNNYSATDVIDAITVITLIGGLNGMSGQISIQQDGTGYVVTFAAAGRNVKYSQAVPTTAGATITCDYVFRTVNGVDLLIIYPVLVE